MVAVLAFIIPSGASAGPRPAWGSAEAGQAARVTVFSLTDFHGHIENGPAVAAAWGRAKMRNPGGAVMVSDGDLVGGSPYDSASQDDRPALAMAKAWGLSVSAMGNHELDRGVDDFNGRVADPSNGISWVSANVRETDPSAGRLSNLAPYAMRVVNGVRVAFVGAVTDGLFSVEERRATDGLTLAELATRSVNKIAERLSDGDESNGEADAVVALIHEDADAIADAQTPLNADVDLVIAGHSHAVKTGRSTPSGAPIVEGGSYGETVACQDLLVSGSGRHATVRVESVPLGADGEQGTADAASAVTRIADSRVDSGPMVRETQAILDAAQRVAGASGDRVVGTLAQGATFAKPVSHRPSSSGARVAPAPPEDQLGTLVADSALASAQASTNPRSRSAVVGFVNPGSMRQDSLDVDVDGRVTERETHTLLALRFRNATIELTGAQLRGVLAQQWRKDGAALSCLGVSSNVDYDHQYVVNDDGTREVVVTGVTVDGRRVRDGDRITVAGNSFLLGGGDGYTAFRSGRNYRDTGVGYADALDAYLEANPRLGAYFD